MSTAITLHPAIEKVSTELTEELAKIEHSVTTKFSLADAIREGSTKATQNHGNWVGQYGEICALSMAAASVRARNLA